MRVLAIDPGERVGWAVGEVSEDKRDALGGPELVVFNHGISSLKDFALKLHEVAGDYDVIVFEDYRISAAKLRAHTGSNVPTIQLIGMIRLCAWLNPKVKLVTQYNTQKKTADRTMPEWLRERIAGLPAAHDDAHDGDALRHLWFWFWTNYVN